MDCSTLIFTHTEKIVHSLWSSQNIQLQDNPKEWNLLFLVLSLFPGRLLSIRVADPIHEYGYLFFE